MPQGGAEGHAEVKGVGGAEESFIITVGEDRKAQADPLFVLYVVLSPRSPSRRLVRYTGAEYLSPLRPPAHPVPGCHEALRAARRGFCDVAEHGRDSGRKMVESPRKLQ
jgi:hypothetical protein